MNYYRLHQQEMKEISGRPSLLFHVCCGVCSVYPLQYLRQYFDITVFFSNSNIYPYEEYTKRLDALREYLGILNDDSIRLIIPPYDNDSFTEKLAQVNDGIEGGKRCRSCYRMRMEEACAYAEKNHYDYFSSVMSISNRKNADYINEIGEELQKLYPHVKYLHADFKKADGITKNEALNKELGLYHQNYCGCIFSQHHTSGKNV